MAIALFQFLIGKLKTGKSNFTSFAGKRFQFLIGKLKTKFNINHMEVNLVSIPYR